MGGENCDQTARRINQRADGKRKSEEVGERKRIPACLRRRINPTAARSQHMFESRKKDAAAAGEGLEYGLATAAARVRSGIREEETMPALRQLLPLSRRCLFKPICKPSNRVKCAFPVSQQPRPRPRTRSALALFDSVSLSLSMYWYLRGKSLILSVSLSLYPVSCYCFPLANGRCSSYLWGTGTRRDTRRKSRLGKAKRVP